MLAELRTLLGTLLLIGATALVACEESIETEESAPGATATNTPSEGGGRRTHEGGGSALGGAKRSAENTRDKVNQQQRELEKTIEDMNDGS